MPFVNINLNVIFSDLFQVHLNFDLMWCFFQWFDLYVVSVTDTDMAYTPCPKISDTPTDKLV